MDHALSSGGMDQPGLKQKQQRKKRGRSPATAHRGPPTKESIAPTMWPLARVTYIARSWPAEMFVRNIF